MGSKLWGIETYLNSEKRRKLKTGKKCVLKHSSTYEEI